MDQWLEIQMDDGRVGKWMGRWIARWMDEWMDGQMDNGWVGRLVVSGQVDGS